MGLELEKLCDEEWSYIPVGGPLPIEDQCVTAFGSAANLVHPASGYSIARSFREAAPMAKAIQTAVSKHSTVGERSKHVWRILWSPEKRTQVHSSRSPNQIFFRPRFTYSAWSFWRNWNFPKSTISSSPFSVFRCVIGKDFFPRRCRPWISWFSP